MRARLALILLPLLTALVLVVAPASVAEASTAHGTSTEAGGWLSRSTAGLQQPARLVERMRETERARVLAVVKILTAPPPPVTDPRSFIWPARGPITAGFGHPNGRRHDGVDIDAPYGAPIVASQAGVVQFVGTKRGYGNTIVVDHGHGISTLYAHQSKMIVRVGQHVTQGQQLGNIGATGDARGAHLHYEVHVNGALRNPMGWL